MTDEMPAFPFDLGPLPPPHEKDAQWAWRLWHTLQISDEAHGIQGGIWDMPGVGRYRRTGINELTLTEIHATMEPDNLGVTVWNKHDWICILAQAIGWDVVSDQVKKADQDVLPADEDEPALEHIGKVFACPCGMIYSLRGPHSDVLRLKVSDDGSCLNPNCTIILPYPHAGVLNAVDDGAVIAKHEAQDLLDIAMDEEEYQPQPDEYPAPPEEVRTEGSQEEE